MKPGRDPSDEELISGVRAHFDAELTEAQVRFRGLRRDGRRAGGRVDRPRRSVPRAVAALAALSLAAILVAASAWMAVRSPATSGGGTATPGWTWIETTGPTPSPTPGPSVTSAAPSPSYLSGPIGFNGSLAWILSPTGLSISHDAGRSWSSVALPNGVQAASVMTVLAAEGRAVWLAVQAGRSVRLYRQSAGEVIWSSALLTPLWIEVGPDRPPDSVLVDPGPGSVVTVTELRGLGMQTASTTTFVSADDGRTFVGHEPDGWGSFWHSVTFVSPRSGVAVIGPSTADSSVIYTTDGGGTWSAASASLPEPGLFSLSKPTIVGTDIEMLMTRWPGDGSTTYSLLVSHDGGATFVTIGTAPRPEATDLGLPSADTLGQVTWIAPGGDAGVMYETNDGGTTWSTISSVGLPAGSEIHLTGPTSATAVVWENGCAGFKTGCWQRSYLVATTDGGRTWSNL